MVAERTRHYGILRDYVHKVAEDLVARGRIRRGHGQTLDVVIQHEVQIVIAEIAGDVRALALELGVGVVAGGAMWFESFARQKTREAVSAGASTLLEVLTGRSREKR